MPEEQLQRVKLVAPVEQTSEEANAVLDHCWPA
jgi:hypothetical protein